MAVWNKVYAKVNWQNKPSRLTPLGRSKLQIHDDALDIIDDRVIQLNENKIDKYTYISSPIDLDTLLESGIYSVPDMCTNRPSMNGGGKATVFVSAEPYSASGFITQILVNQLQVEGTQQVFYRIGKRGMQTTTFLPWNRIAGVNDVNSLNKLVAAAVKQWDLGAYKNISLLYCIGNPETYYPANSQGSNAYSLDISTGTVYKNTRTGESTYSWVQDAQLVLITDNLTTKTETHNLADNTQKWVNGFNFSINYQGYGEPDSDRYESSGDNMYLDKSNGRLWKTYYGSWVPTTLYLSTSSDNNKQELTQESIERGYMYRGDTKYFYFAEADIITGNAGAGISIDIVKALNDEEVWDGNNYTIGGITYSIGVSNDGYITGISFEGISEGSSLRLCRVNDSVYVETYLFNGNEKIAYIRADSEYSHIKDVGYGIVCMMEENTPVTVSLSIPSGVNATELRDWSSSAGLREMTVWSLKASGFSGDYNDLTNKPTIPTKTSELTNDSGFLTSHQDISGKYDKTGGTISGDVRIKGSGNYGNKLNLGDGDYVYISEPSDDVMEIHGSSGIYTKDTLYFGAVSGNSKSYKVDASGNANFNALTSGGTAVCLTNDSRLSDSRTPTSHRSTLTTYGAATASYYGHAKLSDTYDTVSTSQKAANSVAASAWALQTAYNTLNTKIPSIKSKTYSLDIPALAGTGAAGYKGISIGGISASKIISVNVTTDYISATRGLIVSPRSFSDTTIYFTYCSFGATTAQTFTVTVWYLE